MKNRIQAMKQETRPPRRSTKSSTGAVRSLRNRPSRHVDHTEMFGAEDEDSSRVRNTFKAPLQWDEMMYLDPREERAAMRDHYSTAVWMNPTKKDTVLVSEIGDEEDCQ